MLNDITMCSRRDCHVAEQCKRSPLSGTKPNERQWYCDYRYEIAGKECRGFMQVNPVEEVNYE